jgi:tetratricopeptide (TPR) repeat protein
MLSTHIDSNNSELAQVDGLALAKCQERLNDPVAALGTLARLAKRFPSDADVIYSLAKFHMRAFNDATLAMFQHSASSYRVHQLSAEIFEVQGRYDAAVDEYKKAIALQPKAPDVQYRLGRAILMKSHDPAALAEARKAFEAERELNPEDAATEFQLGQIAQVQNATNSASTHFERALQLSPDLTEAMVALAKIDTAAHRYDSAITRLKRAVELQPANEAAHYALMMAYRDSGRTNEAKAEKAILDRLQRPPEGEFSQFLKKLGEKPPQP